MTTYYYEPEQPQSSYYYQLESDDYELVIRQRPREALVAQSGKQKSRKPVDPPPIIELKVRHEKDPMQQYLQSPYLFMCAHLIADEGGDDDDSSSQGALCGTMVSSLHRLKDADKGESGFFVFGDLSVQKLGTHRLRFSLHELVRETGVAVCHKTIDSASFQVVQQKEWSGLPQSTSLSRSFADQGVRLRLRKEPRTILKPSPGVKRAREAEAGPSSGQLLQQQWTPGSSYQSSQTGDDPFDLATGPALKRNRSMETPDMSSYYMPPGGVPPQIPRSGGYGLQQSYSFPMSAPRSSIGTPASSTTSGWGQPYPINPSSAAQSMASPYAFHSPHASSRQDPSESMHYNPSYAAGGAGLGLGLGFGESSSSSAAQQHLPHTQSTDPAQYAFHHPSQYRSEHAYSPYQGTSGSRIPSTMSMLEQPALSTLPSIPSQQPHSQYPPDMTGQPYQGGFEPAPQPQPQRAQQRGPQAQQPGQQGRAGYLTPTTQSQPW